jgi:hypothetical protein
MFIYIQNLNELSGWADPLELVTFLNRLYTQFDELMEETGVYKARAAVVAAEATGGCRNGTRVHGCVALFTAIYRHPPSRRHCR